MTSEAEPTTYSRANEREGVGAAWRKAWADTRFRWAALVTPLALLAVLRVYAVVLNAIERRPGAVLQDPVLARIPTHDVSGLTFTIVYGVLLAGVALVVRHPRALVVGTQAYAIMTVLRMIALFLMPLDPPPQMIPLRDPFAEQVAVGTLLTRDLFFSGHTATVFLFTLAVPGKWAPRVFALCTALVASCVLVQHVHYTVDVAAAPLAAYAAYGLAARLNGRPCPSGAL